MTESVEIDLEKAFQRLELILEKMNSGKATLDESLALYEEADRLIASCGRKLEGAQAKVQMLIKKRNGELECDEQGRPRVQELEPQA